MDPGSGFATLILCQVFSGFLSGIIVLGLNTQMHHVLRGVRDGVSSEQNLKNNGIPIPLKPEKKVQLVLQWNTLEQDPLARETDPDYGIFSPRKKSDLAPRKTVY